MNSAVQDVTLYWVIPAGTFTEGVEVPTCTGLERLSEEAQQAVRSVQHMALEIEPNLRES